MSIFRGSFLKGQGERERDIGEGSKKITHSKLRHKTMIYSEFYFSHEKYSILSKYPKNIWKNIYKIMKNIHILVQNRIKMQKIFFPIAMQTLFRWTCGIFIFISTSPSTAAFNLRNWKKSYATLFHLLKTRFQKQEWNCCYISELET